MKIFILLASLFLLAKSSMSQIRKGQFLVGGTISFESEKNEGRNIVNYKTENFFFSPGIGYFVISKLAAGISLDVRRYKQNASGIYSQTSFAFLPFLRYYLLPPKQMFNVLIDASYINYKAKVKFQGSQAPSFQREYGYSISAGPSVFLNQHLALEFLVSYRDMQSKTWGDSRTSNFSTALGLQIHLNKIKASLKHKNSD